MVETSGISKIFTDPKRGKIVAVDSVDFVALPGQVTGLLGINGAGKTTVLRMLSTVIQPTSGTGTVAGYSIQSQGQDVRRNIGFLSNSTALYGRLTAKEMLSYFGQLYGLRGDDLAGRIEGVIQRLNIGEFRDQLCDKLSTGQKQRVSIARAILHDPPVLFFDEPTAGLDVVTAQTIMEFIEEVRSTGKTVVFSTHIMSEVDRLCDQVTVIHQGRVCGRGSVPELKEQASEENLERAFLKLVGYEPERRSS